MKKSATTSILLEKTPVQANKKRSSLTDDEENTKRFKRTKSDCGSLADEEKPQSEENFSLNQFYLETFLCILSSALTDHRCLFNEHELHLFQTFPTLSGTWFSLRSLHIFSLLVSSQILFVRLLMRRCKWLRRSTINYELPDLTAQADHFTPLVQLGFLQDSE